MTTTTKIVTMTAAMTPPTAAPAPPPPPLCPSVSDSGGIRGMSRFAFREIPLQYALASALALTLSPRMM